MHSYNNSIFSRTLFATLARLSSLVFIVLSAWQFQVHSQNPEIFNPNVTSLEEATDDELVSQEIEITRLKLDLLNGSIEERIERVLKVMTLDEKIGQLCQIASFGKELPDKVALDLKAGRIGSLFYTGSVEQIIEAQRVAQEESRLGLPLLVPRDVIHGFRTIFPIPIGQAASWDADLVREAASIAAQEAKTVGINWTFAPMIDISRDARWGRIAESVGEDPVLGSAIAQAMVNGFQGQSISADGTVHFDGIAACAKHFAAYGLSEGGRDYNRAQVAVSELHNVFLAPFHAAVGANCLTFMTGFSSVNGAPATGHKELIRNVLKERWGFGGLVVSDWGSVIEMIDHGFAADKAEAAQRALSAGVDMEMATDSFRLHIKELLESGQLSNKTLDEAVARVLRVKFTVAIAPENASKKIAESNDRGDSKQYLSKKDLSSTTILLSEPSQEIARELSRKSIVLLKNEGNLLPLTAKEKNKIALIGPLSHASRDQLGCWMLDGRVSEAITLAEALKSNPKIMTTVVPALDSDIDTNPAGFAEAVAVAKDSDVAIVCVGEGWKLSGEARCRADINLPGAQSALIKAVAKTKTPIVIVVLAGRPLTIGDELEFCEAALYAWHPGTMGGPAIADLLLGIDSPSGKLPVTFPKHVGQAPLYYNHPNTGRPALAGTRALIGSGLVDFPEEQKYRSHYLDVDPFPLFPFGYGLSYTTFEYSDLEITTDEIAAGQTLGVRVRLTNTGNRTGEEVAQLYIQDVTASLVRPVRELKAFRRIKLEAGESTVLEFSLNAQQLAYYNNQAELVLEPGLFRIGVGGDSQVPFSKEFKLVSPTIAQDSYYQYRRETSDLR